MSNIFNPDFQDFLHAFETSNVEYILVGGYSVIVHGYSRTTGDMDLFVNATIANYSKILNAFYIFNMPIYDMNQTNFLDSNNFDVFEFGRPPMAIDIMTKMKGVDFVEAYQNKLRYIVDENLSINVLHINNLIQAKIAAGRSKDLSDVEYLTKISNKIK